MEIKASSKYDWETIKKFYAFSFNKKHIWPNVIFIGVLVLVTAMYGLELAMGTFTTDLLPSLVMFLALYLMVGYIRFVLPRIRYNKNKLLHGIENTIVFTENSFTISQSSENTSGASTVNYDAVYKIYETKEYIYVYITQSQAHFVDKFTITGGTDEELRAFLIDAVGAKKYKIKM